MQLPPHELALDRSLLAPHAISNWARTDPDSPVLQHVDGTMLTYAELDAEGRTWADGLRALGIDRGTHVGTFLANQFDSFRLMVALGWLCAVEVPVNAAYVGRVLLHALRQADVRILIATLDLAAHLAGLTDDLPGLELIVVTDTNSSELQDLASVTGRRCVGRDQLLHSARAADDLTGPEYSDLAALLFTSGTTGPSKAVRMPWGAIYQNWSWVPEDTLRSGEGLHCALPLFHNSGRSGFNTVVARGGRFVMRDKFSASSVWDEVRRLDCAALALVGPLTALLHASPPRPDDRDNPVRHVILGPMIPEIEDFKRRFGVKVCVAYGQTEIGCPITTGWDHGPADSCGRVRDSWPWPEIRVVDRWDHPVGPGQPGELLVRNQAPWSMNLGYYEMDAETVGAWRNGWFHTGDLLSYDTSGNFYFVDRLADAIRRRGENISSFEVESYVNDHPDVLECAAVGVTSPLGDEEVLVAVIVRDHDGFDPKAFVLDLEREMPAYMVPRYVEVYEDLPRSETTGRTRKAAIRERGVTVRTWDRMSA